MNLDMLFEANNYLGLTTILMYLGLTLVLTVIVFIVYKLTFTGVAYSNNFNVSIVLTGLITAMIMMVIGNNLALSLGMVGALSIVRFRAAIKEPKDISYLFWSIAIGLSAGTGAFSIAIAGTLFIAVVILVFHFIPNTNNSYLLILKGNDFDAESAKEMVEKHSKRSKLKVKNIKNSGTEIIYEIRVDNDGKDLLNELENIDGLNQVNIVSFDGQLNE